MKFRIRFVMLNIWITFARNESESVYHTMQGNKILKPTATGGHSKPRSGFNQIVKVQRHDKNQWSFRENARDINRSSDYIISDEICSLCY